MARRRMTTSEADAQFAVARQRTKTARESGTRAAAAFYDPGQHRIVVLLTSGVSVGVPVTSISYLATATPAQLQRVSVTPTGSGISWEELDVDLSVEGLLVEAIGRKPLARALGRVGGRSTSEAKAATARANGAKGGRPRKHAA